MMIAHYDTKKACKESIGQPLRYTETSFFGPEYKENGTVTVAHRPAITRRGREWFGQITLKDGLIVAVR